MLSKKWELTKISLLCGKIKSRNLLKIFDKPDILGLYKLLKKRINQNILILINIEFAALKNDFSYVWLLNKYSNKLIVKSTPHVPHRRQLIYYDMLKKEKANAKIMCLRFCITYDNKTCFSGGFSFAHHILALLYKDSLRHLKNIKQERFSDTVNKIYEICNIIENRNINEYIDKCDYQKILRETSSSVLEYQNDELNIKETIVLLNKWKNKTTPHNYKKGDRREHALLQFLDEIITSYADELIGRNMLKECGNKKKIHYFYDPKRIYCSDECSRSARNSRNYSKRNKNK